MTLSALDAVLRRGSQWGGLLSACFDQERAAPLIRRVVAEHRANCAAGA